MNKSRKRKINIPMCISMVLLYLIVITAQLLSGMYAVYTSDATASDTGRTAAFVFDMKSGTDSEVLDLTNNIKKPGDKASYKFIVTNSDGSSRSEVAQKYTIEFKEIGSLPLTYTYKTTELPAQTATINKSINTVSGQLPTGQDSQVEYVVDVVWDESKNDAKYSSGSGIASLKIDVISEQID